MFRLMILVLSVLLSGLSAAMAQNPIDKVKIQTIKVKDGIYMLMGEGGNIGLSIGKDGVIMIDDQYAPLTDKILAAVKKLSDKPVKFIINTHWHFDHTGGNENLGKKGSIIVAHHNIHQRMSAGQFMKVFNMNVPPASEVALPVITFNDEVAFHMNGQTILAKHTPHAHTDGDSYLTFQEDNVVHMGDLFFNGIYPFIDVQSGGSIYGVIEAVGLALTKMDDETKVIPGHGPLSNKKQLENYHHMLITVVDRLTALIKKGLSQEEVIARTPLKDLNPDWQSDFMPADKFISHHYQTIADHHN